MAAGKRKKHHDRDKYYHLAKEQGLRSRAAFKLSQINRKYPVLEPSSSQGGGVILDLCAAPGGWTQIAARTCPSSTHIIAVDILPIRAFKGHPNVTTIVGDITTDKCRAEINQHVAQFSSGKSKTKNSVVDVVLHDGAPNVGAEYGKDAYEQNELCIHALKCATHHLKPGGTFVTKVYRSRDYPSLQWLLQQLFETVTVFKPPASRPQSAEIFVLCHHYKAPLKLDPKLLDPQYIFQAVEGQTTGGGMHQNSNSQSLHVLHKKWETLHSKPNRDGYDETYLDATLRHAVTVREFVLLKDFTPAVQLLSRATHMIFQCPTCTTARNMLSTQSQLTKSCHCAYMKHHPLTHPEIVQNLQDLKVLNKSDFKTILNWRERMQQACKAKDDESDNKNDNDDDDDDDDDEKASDDDDSDSDSDDSEAEEAEIQSEIAELKRRRYKERKRLKKKERAVAAKRRRQAALGMDLNAIELPDQDNLFQLHAIGTAQQLEGVAEANLDTMPSDDDNEQDDDLVIVGKPEPDGPLEEAEQARRRERDLEEAYQTYLETTKSAEAKRGTKAHKRSKKAMRQKVLHEAMEDQEMLQDSTAIGQDTLTYARMLSGEQTAAKNDSDSDDSDSDDDDSDDGFHAEPVDPAVHAAMAKRRKLERETANPLIYQFEEEASSVKAARWFSNPLFEKIQQSARGATTTTKTSLPKRADIDDSDNEDDNNNAEESDAKAEVAANDDKPNAGDSAAEDGGDKKKKKQKTKRVGLDAEEVLAMMPKTDKEKRHIKRLKQMAKDERKKARRAAQLGEQEGEFELAPARVDSDDSEDDDDAAAQKLQLLSPAQRAKVLEARQQIKAGLGKAALAADDDDKVGFEVVKADDQRPLPVKDDRKYDSDHEAYDSDDYATTLALGTMILRKSKEKALVDASYNRFAWNDPSHLPEWFVDDEKRHYKPQLPIPPALVAKMKEKMMALATKPIAKVAEARARKSKRARDKLAAAKKKAEAVANSKDMSEAMKLKAISKALRGQEAKKKEVKYVVAKKSVGTRGGGKGTKVVDKRMKSDKRAVDRAEKKRKRGKQNGLVGSKKRRNHR